MAKSLPPDISDIFARKAAGRRERAQRSFADKLDVLDRLKALADEARNARVLRSEALLKKSND